jgi:hypothetical protein
MRKFQEIMEEMFAVSGGEERERRERHQWDPREAKITL